MDHNGAHSLDPSTVQDAFRMMSSCRGARGRMFWRIMLEEAAAQGAHILFLALMNAGASTDRHGRSVNERLSLLAEAVLGENEAIVAEVISTGRKKKKTLVDAICGKKHSKTTALLLAARLGVTAIGIKLLDAEADPGLAADTADGTTPVHEAAEGGHVLLLRALLDGLVSAGRAPSVVNAKAKNGTTALHLAADGGHAKVVCMLLGAGADKDARNIGGITPLYQAITMGHVGVVVELLAAGAEFSSPPLVPQLDDSLQGMVLVHGLGIASYLGQAAYVNSLEMVRWLLARGCKPDESATVTGATALHFGACSSNDNSDVIDLLIERGADVEARLQGGVTSLHVASSHATAFPGNVEALLKAGAKVDAQLEASKETALHLACRVTHVSAVKALLDQGASLKITSVDGMTAADVVGAWCGSRDQCDRTRTVLSEAENVRRRSREAKDKAAERPTKRVKP